MKSKGRHHVGPMKKEQRIKTSRVVYLCIAAVYFLVVVGATAYSLTAYQEQLPQVELIKPDRGRLPPECLTDGPDGKIMNTVERQDGPWGQRYIIKQFTVYAYQELPDGNLFVYEAVSNENPVVRSTTADFLWDGMEVSISLE
ncbi:hypothetical protein [Acutalibacter sp. JLR.KK004]|uniref:hypothetical protein n=1 Tax=Acutalibacter sp. JLR.KK004 TaxID=3112622 RepID=UPI002FEFC365